MSRTVNGEVMFGFRERGTIRRMLEAVADFSGVRVLTFCLMKNHFHVLVQVPDKKGIQVSDAELIRRYRVLHQASEKFREGVIKAAFVPATVAQVKEIFRRGGADAEELRQRLLRRMHDLSEFVKTFKQRISIWMNVTKKRYGPLWCGRFKSVLVEGRKEVLRVMAAYIDLNPLRAGLVEDPGDYPDSGFGQALRGNGFCIAGLRQITGLPPGHHNETVVVSEYGQMLRCAGSRPRVGKVHVPLGESKGRGYRVVEMGAEVFSQGVVLGAVDWVEDQTGQLTGLLHRKRPVVARKVGESGLATAKNCRQHSEGKDRP